MKTFFKNRVAKKLTDNLLSKKFNGLAKAKSALILFRSEKPEKSSLTFAIEKMFESQNIQALSIGYLPLKLEKGTEAALGYLYKNQLNWLGNPKEEFVQDLTNKDYDVIIDLDEELESPNNFILLSAKAGIRVGINKQKDLYDLTVDKANNNEESIVKEIEFYLKNIVKA